MNKKQLLIIGARGYGREVYSMALGSIGHDIDFVVKGFLDDKSDALDDFEAYPPILGSVESYKIQKEDVFLCALGDVVYKKKYVEMILNKGGEFMTLLHKSAYIGKNTHIGKGCIVAYDAHVSCDVHLDDFVTVMTASIIGHDARVGKWSSLGVKTFFGGGVCVGNEVTVHTGAVILPKKKIEDNATVGVCSVVIKNVKSDTTVFGNPAKRL